MKTTELMNALGVGDLKEISGGRIAANVGTEMVSLSDFHIHCIQPEPGTCSCSPANSFAKHENI